VGYSGLKIGRYMLGEARIRVAMVLLVRSPDLS